MRLDIKQETKGKWRGILAQFGLTELQLSGKHTSCPICGGKDRFHYDDKYGNGDAYCNQCGHKNGIDLLIELTGKDFRGVVDEIKPLIGSIKAAQPAEKKDAEKIRKQLQALFKNATKKVLVPYLENRGITVKPDVWYHQNMLYLDKATGVKSFHHGMIGVVTNSKGEAIAAHRTYLTSDGRKANVQEPKKVTQPLETINGAAIRLFKHDGVLGIAEGIETACAAYQLTGIPTWAAITAGGMERFVAPENVTKLIIFADNDKAGKSAAYALASRYAEIAEIRIPEKDGSDWADYLGGN